MPRNEPVLIKKKRRKEHGGGHDGASTWKIAYADFTTAMMAFFLLLWLLNSTTEEQLMGIANYFAPESASVRNSGAGGILGGKSMLEPGAMVESRSLPGITISRIPLSFQQPPDGESEIGAEKEMGTAEPQHEVQLEDIPDEIADELLARREQKEFAKVRLALRQAIEQSPDLKALSENLIIDMSEEGLRMQIVDKDQRSMFPLGSAEMYDYTAELLTQIAEVISRMPNAISVTGHTDATPYHGDAGYTNWELSTERAHASRRTLIEAGLAESRIQRVVGKADRDPLVADDPFSPSNRRISIVLLRENRVRTQREEVTDPPTSRPGSRTQGPRHRLWLRRPAPERRG